MEHQKHVSLQCIRRQNRWGFVRPGRKLNETREDSVQRTSIRFVKTSIDQLK